MILHFKKVLKHTHEQPIRGFSSGYTGMKKQNSCSKPQFMLGQGFDDVVTMMMMMIKTHTRRCTRMQARMHTMSIDTFNGL